MKHNSKRTNHNFIQNLILNYNSNWAVNIFNANKNNLENVAIFYRGRNITYREMFEEACTYAASLKALGIHKGHSIPLCVNYTPETFYLIIAASIIGAEIKIFGSEFKTEYIKQILHECDNKVIFVTDSEYAILKPTLENLEIDKIIMFSINDSFLGGENPYAALDLQFNCELGEINGIESKNILDLKNFKELGLNTNSKLSRLTLKEKIAILLEKTHLSDVVCTIYSNDDFNPSIPKPIKFTNKTFNAKIAYNGSDSMAYDLSSKRTLIHMPLYNSSSLITQINTTLASGGTCALEYIYNSKFFMRSLIINKPNICYAPKDFWLKAMSDLPISSPNTKMPYITLPIVEGDIISPGEERFLNDSLKKYCTSSSIKNMGKKPILISTAYGPLQFGNVIYAENKNSLKNQTSHYKNELFNYTILDEEGEKCFENEIGHLVVQDKLACSLDADFFYNPEDVIFDNDGKVWIKSGYYAFKNFDGEIIVKGKGNQKDYLPLSIIKDVIEKDTKHILSCELVSVFNREGDDAYVAHIIKQPNTKLENQEILEHLEIRLRTDLPPYISERVVYKFRDLTQGFPLSVSGHVKYSTLKQEGLQSTFKICLGTRFNKGIYSGEFYIRAINESKKIMFAPKNKN